MIAVVCSTVLALSMFGGFAAFSDSAYAADANTTLKVSIVNPDDSPALSKTFTMAELEAIASTAAIDGAAMGQYAKNGSVTVYYAAKYVTFDSLASAAGITLAESDNISIPDNSKWSGGSFSALKSGRFYPQQTPDDFGAPGDTLPAGLALTVSSGSGNTASVALDSARVAAQSADKCIMSIMGIYDLEQTGGNRFWTGITELKIKLATTYVPVKKITPKVTLSKSTYTYTGKTLKPSVTVRDGSTVIAPANYTVTYKNNKVSGKATVTVKLRGAYEGSATAAFKINPAKPTSVKAKSTAKKTVKVTWKKATADKRTGYIVKYSTKKNMKGAKTLTVKKDSAANTQIKKLVSKKTYYVQVAAYKAVGSAKYTSAYSKAVKVKVK